MNKNKLVLVGTSIMLEKCIEISIKNFEKIFVITQDKKIKKKFKNKVKFINLNNIKRINSDYLFSVLNEKILSLKQLDYVKKSSINFHDGPLPKYAGLFSSSWAIYNNEKKHGVCWHKIEKSIDAGDILTEMKFKINKNDTAYNVDTKGMMIGIKLFKKIVQNIKKNTLKFKKQNLKKRTYFGKSKLKNLLKRYIKDKNNKTLSNAFAVSPQKLKILNNFFKIKIKNFTNDLRSVGKKNGELNILRLNKLIKVLNKTLKINFIYSKNSKELNKLSLNSHPKWDSLAHVKLLSNIERKFKISINENNIEHFSNLKLMFNYLNKKKKLK